MHARPLTDHRGGELRDGQERQAREDERQRDVPHRLVEACRDDQFGEHVRPDRDRRRACRSVGAARRQERSPQQHERGPRDGVVLQRGRFGDVRSAREVPSIAEPRGVGRCHAGDQGKYERHLEEQHAVRPVERERVPEKEADAQAGRADPRDSRKADRCDKRGGLRSGAVSDEGEIHGRTRSAPPAAVACMDRSCGSVKAAAPPKPEPSGRRMGSDGSHDLAWGAEPFQNVST